MNPREHEDISLKVEKAREQIAKLRKQQEELEHEKSTLEDLRNRLDEWYRGKKEVGEALRKSIAVLENEESEISKMSVLVRNAKENFSSLLAGLDGVKEERWAPQTLKDELDKALLILQKGRKELSVARARIPVLDETRRVEEGERLVPGIEPGRRIGGLGSGDLLRIGFWLALPAALMALVIIIVLSLV